MLLSVSVARKGLSAVKEMATVRRKSGLPLRGHCAQTFINGTESMDSGDSRDPNTGMHLARGGWAGCGRPTGSDEHRHGSATLSSGEGTRPFCRG